MRVRQIEFEKLRYAYLTVKAFLEKEAYSRNLSLNSKIAQDMNLKGDDNYELLVRFVEQFELEHKDFEYSKHFHSEGELFGLEGSIHNLLRLFVLLPLIGVKKLTFNKRKITPPEAFNPEREVSDLSFKDLITWYLEKDYSTSKKVRFELKSIKSI